MMKKYIMMLAAAALLLGCNEKEDNPVSHDSIDISEDILTFGPEGGSKDVKVTSSGDWRLSGLCDWVKTSATQGKDGAVITFTAEANDSQNEKEATFKVFTGSAVSQVLVKTTPAYVAELKSDSEVNVISDGATVKVKLETNIPNFDIEYSDGGADWITYSGREDVFGVTFLNFNVVRSKVFKSRESVLKLSGSGKEVSVKLVQAQRDTIIFTENRAVYDLASRDVEVKVKTNLDPDIALPEWIEQKESTAGSEGEDGLTERTYKFHLSEAVASRQYTMSFKVESTEFGKYTIKQQNPNPVLCNISDAVLRTKLTGMGWIIADESSTECEVLEPGMTATTLSLAGAGYYDQLKVQVIDGLGAFPKLETLSIQRASDLTKIDVSDSKSLKTVKFEQSPQIAEIKTGASPVEEVNFGSYQYDYIETSTVVVSGDNIKTVNANSSSLYINYGYDSMSGLDVTGCPSLTTLKAKREYSGWSGAVFSLKTIYITAAQKAAIDAGTLTVEKSDGAVFEVK